MLHRGNRFSLIIVACFLLAVCVPFVGAILEEDRGLSYTEKRKLRQLPSFPDRVEALPQYITGFEEYYNDQFGLRDVFLKSYSRVKRLIGDHDISGTAANIGSQNIIKGKDGWFFLNRKWDGDPFSDYRNLDLYSDGELLRATILFAARADWLKNQDIEYLFFFAPNKHTIYSEYIPDYIRKEGDISSWDQLNDALRRHTNVHFVDLREPLLQAKDEAARYWKDKKDEAALYYKKDSHWNGAGVDIAQFVIAGKIEQLFPGKIKPAKRPLDDFVMKSFAGDITLIMGGREKEAYGPALTGGTCTPQTFTDYLQRHHVTVCSRGRLDALIFNDSFMPPLKPYFTDYFHRVKYRWEQMQEGLVVKELSVNKPDIVIEQRAERFLPFTPRAGYSFFVGFWDKHWHKWKKELFVLDLEKAAQGGYQSKNMELRFDRETRRLEMVSHSNDPMLILGDIGFQSGKPYLIRTLVESAHDTVLQVYYSAESGGAGLSFSETRSLTVPLKKGENTVYVPLLSLDVAGGIRFDPGKHAGRYVIREFQIKELNWVDFR